MIVLVEGPHDGLTLPLLARKHKTLHMADGSVYNRLIGAHKLDEKGGPIPTYLWSDWKPRSRA